MSVSFATTTFNKNDILQRAVFVQHSMLFDPTSNQYVQGFVGMPVDTWEYQKQFEPVVDLSGFNDISGDCWLTVNHYNAVVLSTRNMLIADIDFGDSRLSANAGAICAGEVIDALKDLATLDKGFLNYSRKVRFSEQAYRVYETHSGWRVICTSIPLPIPAQEYAAMKLMQFLKSDRKYMALCDAQGCYRARLTPKPWRDYGCESHVCNLLETIGSEDVHPDLQEQLALHDEMTLRKSHDSSLA